jgi:hypothetical protein
MSYFLIVRKRKIERGFTRFSGFKTDLFPINRDGFIKSCRELVQIKRFVEVYFIEGQMRGIGL